jgi:hypothetical protein
MPILFESLYRLIGFGDKTNTNRTAAGPHEKLLTEVLDIAKYGD